MKELELRYVAAAYPITCRLSERYSCTADTLRQLIMELDNRYGGFAEMFLEPGGGLTLNTMIYYGEEDGIPKAVLDADQAIADQATVTFW